MADNYLEKKMEQHKVRAVASATAPRGVSVFSLLESSLNSGFFDGFVVRDDQLMRIVGAAARVDVRLPFRFRCVRAGDAAIVRACHAGIVKSTAYIAICPVADCECDAMLVGRVVQAMLMQAAEIGLCGCMVSNDFLPLVGEVLSLPLGPVVLVAVGRSAEPSLAFDTPSSDVDVSGLLIE